MAALELKNSRASPIGHDRPEKARIFGNSVSKVGGSGWEPWGGGRAPILAQMAMWPGVAQEHAIDD